MATYIRTLAYVCAYHLYDLYVHTYIRTYLVSANTALNAH